MARYLPEPPLRQNAGEKTAIVLVNLGSPDAPTAPALRRYLREFLSDPRVVELPRLLWWPILNGIILNIRPRKSAAKYASVWLPEGSPLRVHTERQAKLLKGLLGSRGHDVLVDYAMRYGNPALPDVLSRLKADGATHIVLLPMYPQYAAATTATVIDAACSWLQATRNQPEVRWLRQFHDDDGYLAALEQSVRRHWQKNGNPAVDSRLLISFHGLPLKSIEQGDPYYHDCCRTGRLLAERLGLADAQYAITFQSRFGNAEWLQPYTVQTLRDWGSSGVRRVDVICPGFVADCLETLEEIGQEGKEEFLAAGGSEYHYIPALNEEEAWIMALARLAEEQLRGFAV